MDDDPTTLRMHLTLAAHMVTCCGMDCPTCNPLPTDMRSVAYDLA